MVRNCSVATWAVMIGLLLGRPSLAAQFVVDPNGNDSAAGTAAAPWKTLQKAANVVNPGDKVTVHSGNYVGFNLTRSGSAALPIEFDAQPGVVVTQRNSVTPDGINLEGASFVVVDGFTVNNMPRTGIRTVGDEDAFAQHVTLRNNTAAGNEFWGILTGFVNDLLIENNSMSGSKQQHGIYVSNSGDRPVVRNNLVFGNHDSGIQLNADGTLGGDGIITGALISGNRIYNNGTGGGAALNLDGVQNARIENNLLFGNHAGGISMYMIDGSEGSKNNLVVNNTIDQASDGRWDIHIDVGSTGNTVRNNILVTAQTFRGALDVSQDSLPGFSSDYNAVVPKFTTDGGDSVLSLAQWRSQTGNDTHSIDATLGALFQNAAGGDYHLLSTAAAIDKGNAANAPLKDFDGKSRPIGAGFDMGAFEFGTAAIVGDYNHDNIIDAADYSVWRDTLGSTTNLIADGDGSGKIDAGDFTVWKDQFAGGSGGGGALSVVAEPSTAFLSLFAVAALTVARFVTAARRVC